MSLPETVIHTAALYRAKIGLGGSGSLQQVYRSPIENGTDAGVYLLDGFQAHCR
jgi:hypothetical protein